MNTHFLRGPRRAMAAAGLIVASVAGVLVVTSSSAQAAAPGLPLTICYAFQGSNPERRVIFDSALSGGRVSYTVQAETWNRSRRVYEFRSRSRVTLSDRGNVLRADGNARCSYFTFGAFPIRGTS